MSDLVVLEKKFTPVKKTSAQSHYYAEGNKSQEQTQCSCFEQIAFPSHSNIAEQNDAITTRCSQGYGIMFMFFFKRKVICSKHIPKVQWQYWLTASVA